MSQIWYAQQLLELMANFTRNETYAINNQVYSILLGGVIPENLKNTTDDNFYTHYST